jgi:hypothetical protein
MNRLILIPVAVGLLAAAPLTAPAQYPAPAPGNSPYSPYYSPYQYSRPPGTVPGGGPRLSPYLNLLRNGTNPAVNYYLGVVPERERRRFEAQSSYQLRALQQEVANPPSAALVPEDEFAPNPSVTGGYVAVFNNTGGYFNNNVAAPGAARPLPPVPRRTPTTTPTTPATPPKK